MRYDIFHNYGFDKIDDNRSLNESFTSDNWRQVDVKSVPDSDGFMTQYAWYTNGDKHIFMFGDAEITEPDEAYADWEEDSEETAKEWFDSYTGFETTDDIFGEDEDMYESHSDATLNEAYNNLPDWLTNYLDTTSSGTSAKRILSNRGIDLANATYIKGVFPRSNRDPVLKDGSRLTIFRFNYDDKHDDVYIVGVTNPYLRVSRAGERYWDYKYANELPMKTILSLATEYGYLDLNDKRNSNLETRKERAIIKGNAAYERGVGQHPVERNIYGTDEYGHRDYNKLLGTETEWVMTRGEDKSGYPLDPDKYIRMLDNVGLDTYGERLESYYKKIELTRSRLIELMSKFDINDSGKYRTFGSFSNNVYSDIAEAMNSFSRAIESYQRVKDDVGKIVKRHEENPSDRTDEKIKHAFAWEGKSFRDYLKAAIDLIGKIEQTEIRPEQY